MKTFTTLALGASVISLGACGSPQSSPSHATHPLIDLAEVTTVYVSDATYTNLDDYIDNLNSGEYLVVDEDVVLAEAATLLEDNALVVYEGARIKLNEKLTLQGKLIAGPHQHIFDRAARVGSVVYDPNSSFQAFYVTWMGIAPWTHGATNVARLTRLVQDQSNEGGGTLSVPDGVYPVKTSKSNTVILRDDVRIVGKRSMVWQLVSGSTGALFSLSFSASDAKANGDNTAIVGGKIACSGGHEFGIRMAVDPAVDNATRKNIEIRDIEIENCREGILAAGTTSLRISRAHVHHNWRAGIGVIGGADITIDNCYLSSNGAGRPEESGTAAINVETESEQTVHRLAITNNVIKDGMDRVGIYLHVGIADGGGREITDALIAGNTLSGLGEGGAGISLLCSEAYPCDHIAVDGNQVSEAGSGINLHHTRHLTVNGNHLSDLVDDDDYPQGGHAIEAIESHHGTIFGNTIGNIDGVGVRLMEAFGAACDPQATPDPCPTGYACHSTGEICERTSDYYGYWNVTKNSISNAGHGIDLRIGQSVVDGNVIFNVQRTAVSATDGKTDDNDVKNVLISNNLYRTYLTGISPAQPCANCKYDQNIDGGAI